MVDVCRSFDLLSREECSMTRGSPAADVALRDTLETVEARFDQSKKCCKLVKKIFNKNNEISLYTAQEKHYKCEILLKLDDCRNL